MLAAKAPIADPYTMASYEAIHERTGIPSAMSAALALLISNDLLINIDREFSKALKVNEANKYYLTGHAELFPRQTAQAAAA